MDEKNGSLVEKIDILKLKREEIMTERNHYILALISIPFATYYLVERFIGSSFFAIMTTGIIAGIIYFYKIKKLNEQLDQIRGEYKNLILSREDIWGNIFSWKERLRYFGDKESNIFHDSLNSKLDCKIPLIIEPKFFNPDTINQAKKEGFEKCEYCFEEK